MTQNAHIKIHQARYHDGCCQNKKEGGQIDTEDQSNVEAWR